MVFILRNRMKQENAKKTKGGYFFDIARTTFIVCAVTAIICSKHIEKPIVESENEVQFSKENSEIVSGLTLTLKDTLNSNIVEVKTNERNIVKSSSIEVEEDTESIAETEIVEEESVTEPKVDTKAVSKEETKNETKDVGEKVKKDTKKEVESKKETKKETPKEEYSWSGPKLTRSKGVNYGPTGKETYYNLNMNGVVKIMRSLGYTEQNYWVRDDGVKMFGDYVIVAANLNVFPRGSIVPTSLGMAMVCDTGEFAKSNPTQLDIAVTW